MEAVLKLKNKEKGKYFNLCGQLLMVGILQAILIIMVLKLTQNFSVDG